MEHLAFLCDVLERGKLEGYDGPGYDLDISTCNLQMINGACGSSSIDIICGVLYNDIILLIACQNVLVTRNCYCGPGGSDFGPLFARLREEV